MANNKRDTVFSKVFKRYLIDAMGAMAYGLFASLIIGTIIGQFATFPGLEFLGDIATVLKDKLVYGAAIGAAVAWGLKADPLVIFTAAGAGAIGCNAGGPLGAFLAAVIGAELGQLVSKKTPVDIVVTPLVTVITGGLVGQFTGPYINDFMKWLGDIINYATELMPLPMGIIVAVIVGMVLTLPISSAALCVMLGLSGLAGGAATAGCCAQMLGFAVISYCDNGFSGLISQGVGTSMLQVPNIVRRPLIWVAPTVAGAVAGALSTTLFQMTNVPAGAGMGTSGLVGILTTYGAMAPEAGATATLIGILVVDIFVPIVVALGVDHLMRRLYWVKKGDMKLQKI